MPIEEGTSSILRAIYMHFHLLVRWNSVNRKLYFILFLYETLQLLYVNYTIAAQGFTHKIKDIISYILVTSSSDIPIHPDLQHLYDNWQYYIIVDIYHFVLSPTGGNNA